MGSDFESVIAFEKACGNELSKTKPAAPDLKTVELRIKLVKEESGELLDALEVIKNAIISGEDVTDEMLADVADGSADTQWVAKGTDIAFGIDGPVYWSEVDRSNMDKFAEGHYYDETGKLRKPPGWTPPDILGLIKSQKPLAEIYQ